MCANLFQSIQWELQNTKDSNSYLGVRSLGVMRSRQSLLAQKRPAVMPVGTSNAPI